MDFPYSAEYSKSSRASCRSCKSTIEKDKLRLAVLVQSPVFDGKVPQWYHYKCFFLKQRPKSVDDIEHYESLRYEDQEKIKAAIAEIGIVLPGKKGKGKKRDAGALGDKQGPLKDFKVEYSKSSRAVCRGCEIKIMKDEIRISKKDFESDVGKRYGGQDMWHHLTCFAKLRSELGYFASGEELPGFTALKKEDKKEVLTQLPAIKQEELPETKKLKTEDDPQEELYKTQSKLIYKHRDQLKKYLSKPELIGLLEYNKQKVPVGVDAILDHLADIMTFGPVVPCEICKGGQYVFNKIGYICQGNLTEWSECRNVIKVPERVPFKISSELQKKYPVLKTYKYIKRERFIKAIKPTNGVKKEEAEDDKPKIERAAPPLFNMEFVILGNPQRGKDVLKKEINKLGGKVVTKISSSLMAVIASETDVGKMGARMKDVKDQDVHVVPEIFVDEAKNHVGKIPALIKSKTICDWGSDPVSRLPQEPTTSHKSEKSKSIYTKSVPTKVKLKLKGGGAVDPDSGLENEAHIYQEGSDKYSTVLGITDIQKKKNSYYKMQLLQSDKKAGKFWVFRSWGRIGTTIGGNILETPATLHEAKHSFREMYEQKSGNMWEDRHNFVKVPGRMYPIDVDYGEDEKNLDVVDSTPCTLKPAIADLMKLIFDVNQMKQMMMEFELDMEKMPLGKISKKQILSAYEILSELQNHLGHESAHHKLIDASNRFYTFIPHSFGIENPPILDSEEIIKQKIEMLDNLMELEIAYNLMKTTGTESNLDDYYSNLNTEIEVLDQKSDEFKLIKDYVKNTHAETHKNYELEILDVFTIKRKGEAKRFKPFKKLHNRKLLWHGSRVTNFAGILSQGLRIAPPEAPSTGYMFGKGIYFADMVSKSANYCCTNSTSPTGILLLCDVALGDMYERPNAEYIEKLPKGKHSTKGLGRTCPNPKESKKIDDVEVPLGKPFVADTKNRSLLYNEYIVYDVAQVQVKYLLKLDFKYKY